MDSATLKLASPTIVWLNPSAITSPKEVNLGYNFKRSMANSKIYSISPNISASSCALHGTVREERIEKPVGLSLAEKAIGDNPRCLDCQAKGAVLCTTCAGSGLYVDSILESQGIIVKVRCLGCGGAGNMMCTVCGGRGHLGLGPQMK